MHEAYNQIRSRWEFWRRSWGCWKLWYNEPSYMGAIGVYPMLPSEVEARWWWYIANCGVIIDINLRRMTISQRRLVNQYIVYTVYLQCSLGIFKYFCFIFGLKLPLNLYLMLNWISSSPYLYKNRSNRL